MATSKKFVAKNGLDNNSNSIDNLGVSGASLTRAGAHSLTLTTAGSTNVTLPTSGTLATVNPRVVAGTNSDTAPTPNADITDIFTLTGLSVNPTFGAPTGTLVNGQKLIIRIKDNGTNRTLNWNAVYVPGGAALPTTTAANKTIHLGFIYNTDNALNKWMLIAKAEEA